MKNIDEFVEKSIIAGFKRCQSPIGDFSMHGCEEGIGYVRRYLKEKGNLTVSNVDDVLHAGYLRCVTNYKNFPKSVPALSCVYAIDIINDEISKRGIKISTPFFYNNYLKYVTERFR